MAVKLSEQLPAGKETDMSSESRIDGQPGEAPLLVMLPYASMSGLELFGVRFCLDLQSRGIPVVLAAPRDSLLHRTCLERQVNWVEMPVGPRLDPLALPRIYRLLRTLKPCAAVGFRTHVMYPFHLARLLTGQRCPLFLFYRLGAGNYQRRDPLHRVLFKHLAAVIPNSDHVKNKILAKWAIAPEKVVCIKSGIDTRKYRPDAERRSAFRKSVGVPDEAFLIGSTGRIHPEKGSEDLLRALYGPGGAAVHRPDVHLVYVGREYQAGYADRLKAMARRFDAETRFHLAPFRAEVEAVYPAFDLFTLAVTSHETYAYVVLEAMACGVPPLIPATGGLKEMVRPGVDGFLYPHRDQEALRRELATVMQHPARLEKIGRAARAWIEREADWDQMMERYLAVFRQQRVEIG